MRDFNTFKRASKVFGLEGGGGQVKPVWPVKLYRNLIDKKLLHH